MTVCAVSEVPANMAVAIQPPISGVESAMLIPIVAAQSKAVPWQQVARVPEENSEEH